MDDQNEAKNFEEAIKQRNSLAKTEGEGDTAEEAFAESVELEEGSQPEEDEYEEEHSESVSKSVEVVEGEWEGEDEDEGEEESVTDEEWSSEDDSSTASFLSGKETGDLMGINADQVLKKKKQIDSSSSEIESSFTSTQVEAEHKPKQAEETTGQYRKEKSKYGSESTTLENEAESGEEETSPHKESGWRRTSGVRKSSTPAPPLRKVIRFRPEDLVYDRSKLRKPISLYTSADPVPQEILHLCGCFSHMQEEYDKKKWLKKNQNELKMFAMTSRGEKIKKLVRERKDLKWDFRGLME